MRTRKSLADRDPGPYCLFCRPFDGENLQGGLASSVSACPFVDAAAASRPGRRSYARSTTIAVGGRGDRGLGSQVEYVAPPNRFGRPWMANSDNLPRSLLQTHPLILRSSTQSPRFCIVSPSILLSANLELIQGHPCLVAQLLPTRPFPLRPVGRCSEQIKRRARSSSSSPTLNALPKRWC